MCIVCVCVVREREKGKRGMCQNVTNFLFRRRTHESSCTILSHLFVDLNTMRMKRRRRNRKRRQTNESLTQDPSSRFGEEGWSHENYRNIGNLSQSPGAMLGKQARQDFHSWSKIM